jgi:hypothetical protein
MRELEKQLEKFRKEKGTLDGLVPRIDKRRAVLSTHIQAIEQLIAGAETIEQTAIPDEVFQSLDKYLPPLNGEGSGQPNLTPVPQRTAKSDPPNKTHLILSLFYSQGLTSHGKGLTTGQVVDWVDGTMTRDDVHKVLSRQSRPETGRLAKQDKKFHLTPAGVKYVEDLNKTLRED